MKKTIITSGLAAVSLAVLIGGAALAQQPPAASISEASAPMPRPARHDARRAQPVTQAEFVQARVSRLTAIDANHDGTVSNAEIRAGAETRRAEHSSQRFERMDADKNGQISRAEFDAGRAIHGRRGERAGPPGASGGEHRGRQMNRRGDEGHGPGRRIARHGPVVIADVQTRLTADFARRDVNHDGVLSPEERRTGASARRERGRDHGAERMAHRRDRAASPTSASPSTAASE